MRSPIALSNISGFAPFLLKLLHENCSRLLEALEKYIKYVYNNFNVYKIEKI